MLVEPESLCWLTGRMVLRRDGARWAEEFARFPALKAIVRDDGTGLGKGLKLERDRRRAANLSDLDDTLDVFPTLREGGRALRSTWGGAARALDRDAVDGVDDLLGLAIQRLPRLLSLACHLGDVTVSAAQDGEGASDALWDRGHGDSLRRGQSGQEAHDCTRSDGKCPRTTPGRRRF